MSMTDYDIAAYYEDVGICPRCKDHVPCGCPNYEDEKEESDSSKDLVAVCLSCGLGSSSTELLVNDGACYNCDTQLT